MADVELAFAEAVNLDLDSLGDVGAGEAVAQAEAAPVADLPDDGATAAEMHENIAPAALRAPLVSEQAGRQVAVLQEDGFACLRRFLPPPSRRALVLCDPSYEIKNDYARVPEMLQDALKRFATGTYAVWYPIIPRPEAHDLPRRLKAQALRAGRSWLHATLTVRAGGGPRPGLCASGMFLVNPPHTLHGGLQQALPQMVELLGQDRNAAHTLEAGG